MWLWTDPHHSSSNVIGRFQGDHEAVLPRPVDLLLGSQELPGVWPGLGLCPVPPAPDGGQDRAWVLGSGGQVQT